MNLSFIDAHVHVWAGKSETYPWTTGFVHGDLRPLSFTTHDLLEHTRPAGVDRVVLIQMSCYQTDNRYMLEVIRQSPERFRGVAMIDANQANPRDNMLELAGQGVRGFRLIASTESMSKWEQSAGIRAMWTMGAETGLKMCLLADPAALPAIERMCRAYPETPVVIDHMARIGMWEEIRTADVDRLCRLAECPRVFVKISAFYALGKKQPPYLDLAPLIHRLRDAYGAPRLMWGSDSPFQVEEGHDYHSSIELIRSRLDFLTVEDRSWILQKTAENVFFS